MEELTSASLSHEDYVFDVEFAAEEISKAIIKLPNSKAAGPDGVCSEHLKFGGSSLKTWITQIFSAILLLECVPSSFKEANITPVYKGKGKDPLDPNSYRGIGVSNVLSKLRYGPRKSSRFFKHGKFAFVFVSVAFYNLPCFYCCQHFKSKARRTVKKR